MEIQKEELIEMTKKLFGTEDVHMFVNGGEYWRDDEYISITRIEMINKMTRVYELEIHWYEFCLNQLAEAIFNLPDEDSEYPFDNWRHNRDQIGVGLEDLQYHILKSGLHPIDYLYEQFNNLWRD